jgi:FkbM family methyltransferase
VGNTAAKLKNELRIMLRRRYHLELVRIRSSPAQPESLLGLRLDNLFSALGINLVLDVGAHQGEYTSFLRQNGYSGRIISFEPIASNYEVLQRRASGDELWETLSVALGSEDGEGEINVTNSTVFSSFHQPNAYALREFGDHADIDHVERVAVRRLDSLLRELARPGDQTFLKMDTQGWDLEVLRGASGVLGYIKALQSEVSMQPIYGRMPNLEESLDRFRELGFSVAGLFPVTYDTSERVVEFDCLCVADTGERRADSAGAQEPLSSGVS